MREIKKYLFFTLGLALALMFRPITAEASADNVRIYDDASLLTDQEEQELATYLQSLNDDVNYVVVTTDSNEHGSNQDSRLQYYYELEYFEADPGVAFLIDMYDREIYVSGYGNVRKLIKNADALDITDNVYRYASKGDYYTCILKAFEQANALVSGGHILRPMRYIAALLLSIVLGFFFTFLWAITERSKIDTKVAKSEILMTGAAIAGTAVIYDTTKVRKSSDSGSSGGHSGGFSGGGFSGGGGGHSGGGHSF